MIGSRSIWSYPFKLHGVNWYNLLCGTLNLLELKSDKGIHWAVLEAQLQLNVARSLNKQMEHTRVCLLTSCP